MHRIVGLVALFALLVVLAPASTTATPLLINGSFEAGPDIPTNDINIFGGSTAITGWTVTGNVIDYLGPPWDVSDGLRAIDLDGNGGIGGIEQMFSAVVGQEYRVAFDLSGNPQGLPQVKSMRVTVDGFAGNYAHDSAGQDLDDLIWQTITFQFIASSTSATLGFSSLSASNNSYGALIDNVSVRPVPEPSTLVLLATGLAAAVYRRRQRNR